MEFSNDRFVFTLGPSELPMFFFTLMVEDKRDYSIYKGEFDMHIVTDDIASFDALMKKFFDGKYYFRVDPHANGLELSFKITIEDIVLKQFKLQVPIFHKLTEREEHAARIMQLENKIEKTEKEEHAARILQLENKIESMQKQFERVYRHMEYVAGNPDADNVFCYFNVNGGQLKFEQFSKRGVETITLDFNQKFRSTLADQLPEIYKKEYGKIVTELWHFQYLQEVEILHFNYEVYPDEEWLGLYVNNTLKRVKITNCPNLKKFDIPPKWWNTKTLIVENCPAFDFEHFFDGTQRSITTIVLADKSDRLMERYSRRFQEIGICLRF